MKRRYDGVLMGLLASMSLACPGDGNGTKDEEDQLIDDDGDGYVVAEDCDDNDEYVNPDAPEYCGDGVDNNCDGVDAVCQIDDDNDGVLAEDDCNDQDASVYPGAYEACDDEVDNDCNGIATTCVEPTMIYDATITSTADAYGTAVFADRVVFGDPSGGEVLTIGDGRVVFFELTEGTVSELDADFVSAGEVGSNGAYGTVITPTDGMLCLSADYHDYDAATIDSGKTWCFSEATVRASTTTLDLASAELTTAGHATEAFARVGGQADVDGDNLLDLAVLTADGVHVVYGDGAPWSDDLVVPDDADITLGECGSSPSYWCGFGAAIAWGQIAVSTTGGLGGEVLIYELPILDPPTPPQRYSFNRADGDSIAFLEHEYRFAVGSSINGSVLFADKDGAEWIELHHPGGESFGYWVDTMYDQDNHELLLVGATGAEFDGTAVGEVFVFDVTANGLPTDSGQAIHRLTAPPGYSKCGSRARGGIITDEGGVNTVITSTCPGSGGAAYVIDSRPLPPPQMLAGDITQPSPGNYRIRKHVVEDYTSYLPWALGLAKTELVKNGGEIVGWRLHDIANGSPLYRAGLRSGDVLRRINDTNVTTPAVVRGLFASLTNASNATVRITRNGVVRTMSYTVVP
jgi:hypothetical protein